MRLLLVSICLWVHQVSAVDVQTSGFGNLIVTSSDSETLGFRNDVSINDGVFEGEKSLRPHSNLGFQLDVNINSQWDFVSQWIFMEQYENNIGGYTRLAFLRYLPSEKWSLRLGRTAFNLFEMSEYRDVGIAYPWARAPTEVYGLIPNRFLDGGDVTFTHDFGSSHWSMTVFLGESEAEVTTVDEPPVEFNNLRGFGIGGQFAGINLYLRHTEGDVAKNNQSTQGVVDMLEAIAPLWPESIELAAQVDFAQHDIRYSSIYVGYDWQNFSIKAELSEVDSSSLVIDDLFNGYLNLAYRHSEHTFYWMGSFTDSPRYRFEGTAPPDPAVIQTLVFTAEISTFFRSNQISHSIGWRWDLRENLAFKIQLQNTRVKAEGNGLWDARGELRYQLPSQTINSLSTGVSFSF